MKKKDDAEAIVKPQNTTSFTKEEYLEFLKKKEDTYVEEKKRYLSLRPAPDELLIEFLMFGDDYFFECDVEYYILTEGFEDADICTFDQSVLGWVPPWFPHQMPEKNEHGEFIKVNEKKRAEWFHKWLEIEYNRESDKSTMLLRAHCVCIALIQIYFYVDSGDSEGFGWVSP